jgi:hypothetical protein
VGRCFLCGAFPSVALWAAKPQRCPSYPPRTWPSSLSPALPRHDVHARSARIALSPPPSCGGAGVDRLLGRLQRSATGPDQCGRCPAGPRCCAPSGRSACTSPLRRKSSTVRSSSRPSVVAPLRFSSARRRRVDGLLIRVAINADRLKALDSCSKLHAGPRADEANHVENSGHVPTFSIWSLPQRQKSVAILSQTAGKCCDGASWGA